jgi:DNA-binding IclR family transcriptional regulator
MDAAAKHRIPVIDRMMDLLARLHDGAGDMTIRGLAGDLAVPRTTVYRILNTLQFHGMVVREPDGAYRLGPKLLTLAARATAEEAFDLTALALPHLRRLSSDTGDTCKISVVEGDRILVAAVVPGNRAYALTVIPGEYLPLATGAAGKMLLAQQPEADRSAALAQLVRSGTVTEARARKLASELVRIRKQGWADDRGEYAPSVNAFAAPVVAPSGQTVAAVSVPFLAGATPDRCEAIKAAVIAVAAAIGAELPRQTASAAPRSSREDEASTALHD